MGAIKSLQEDLQRAASFDANNTYPYIFQQLGYRRAIAQQLLKKGFEEPDLMKIYNHVNQDLKSILGLE